MDWIEACGFTFTDEGHDCVYVQCRCDADCDVEFFLTRDEIYDFVAALLAFVEPEAAQ